jgi:hypothetical protein
MAGFIYENYTVDITTAGTTLLGLDSDGDIASYSLQDQRNRTTSQHFMATSSGPVIDNQTQDPDLKTRILLMFIQATMVSRFFKGWGDQKDERTAVGAGTVKLVQQTSGGNITVLNS